MIRLSPMNYANRSTREREDKVRSPKHRAWIKKHLCIFWDRPGHECAGPVECCHVKTGNGATNRSKASDEKTFPMCRKLHNEQTRLGEAQFERKYDISMNAYADAYAKASPFLRKPNSPAPSLAGEAPPAPRTKAVVGGAANLKGQ